MLFDNLSDIVNNVNLEELLQFKRDVIARLKQLDREAKEARVEIERLENRLTIWKNHQEILLGSQRKQGDIPNAKRTLERIEKQIEFVGLPDAVWSCPPRAAVRYAIAKVTKKRIYLTNGLTEDSYSKETGELVRRCYYKRKLDVEACVNAWEEYTKKTQENK